MSAHNIFKPGLLRNKAVFEQAHAAFGPIDIVVAGAAGNFVAPVMRMSSNGFRAVIDTDLVGTFNTLRAAHEFLRKPSALVLAGAEGFRNADRSRGRLKSAQMRRPG